MFVIGTPTMSACDFMKSLEWGFNKVMLSTELVSPNLRLVQNNSLKIHCRVWIIGDVKHDICKSVGLKRKNLSEDENVKQHKEQLATDFGRIFKDSVMTDFSVITGNKTFMAHKAVLAGMS